MPPDKNMGKSWYEDLDKNLIKAPFLIKFTKGKLEKVNEDPKTKTYVCKHGKAVSYKTARRLIEEKLPVKWMVQAIQEDKCLYDLMEEENTCLVKR